MARYGGFQLSDCVLDANQPRARSKRWGSARSTSTHGRDMIELHGLLPIKAHRQTGQTAAWRPFSDYLLSAVGRRDAATR
jgi:hypothetical protein